MHSIALGGDLRFEVTVKRNEELGITSGSNFSNCYIFSTDARAIEFDVKAFKAHDGVKVPSFLVELHVDGVLRNIVVPYTGRGLPHLQVAEVAIDRGFVVSKEGYLVMKNFRFVYLDLDDAINTSRVVKNAGSIEIRIVQVEGLTSADRLEYDIPRAGNDLCSISFLEGDLNNTSGVKFDDGNDSIHDNKVILSQICHQLMVAVIRDQPRKLLASFSFTYGDEDLLNQLGCIPSNHPLFDKEIARKRGTLSGICTTEDGTETDQQGKGEEFDGGKTPNLRTPKKSPNKRAPAVESRSSDEEWVPHTPVTKKVRQPKTGLQTPPSTKRKARPVESSPQDPSSLNAKRIRTEINSWTSRARE